MKLLLSVLFVATATAADPGSIDAVLKSSPKSDIPGFGFPARFIKWIEIQRSEQSRPVTFISLDLQTKPESIMGEKEVSMVIRKDYGYPMKRQYLDAPGPGYFRMRDEVQKHENAQQGAAANP